MKSLKEISNKVELPVIYLTLSVFIIIKLFSIIFNNSILNTFINEDKIYIFIAAILLYLFRFIDRRLPREDLLDHELTHFPSFDEAMTYILSHTKDIKQIDMFSHSSQTYYTYLYRKFTGNEVVRVILRNPNSSEFLTHLRDQNAKNRELNQIINAIDMWSNIRQNKQVRDAELYCYDFEPSFYLLIINNSIGLIGFFEPCQLDWGYQVNKAILINGKGKFGMFFLNYLIDWYNSTINEKCTKIL